MTTVQVANRPQDPRIRPGQCHETAVIAGAEFVCIALPHAAPGPGPWSLDRALANARTPLARRHFYIPRFPGGSR
jgi:hypothetical protein